MKGNWTQAAIQREALRLAEKTRAGLRAVGAYSDGVPNLSWYFTAVVLDVDDYVISAAFPQEQTDIRRRILAEYAELMYNDIRRSYEAAGQG